MKPRQTAAIGIAAFVLLTAMVMVGAAWEPVDEGQVKVVKDRGAVTGETFDPGWNYRTPLTESVVAIPTRPQTYTMSGNPWEGETDQVDSIGLMSDDEQRVNVEVTVRYKIPSDRADSFHSEWNNIGQAESRIIRPTVDSVVQERASAMNATDIKSEQGRAELSEAVKNQLEEQTGPEIQIQTAQIRDVILDPNYKSELENIEIEKAQREQALIDADADRRSAEIRAEGDAEAYRIRAEALEENDIVLKEEYIKSIGEGDTVVLATNDNGTPIMLNTGAQNTVNGS